MLSPLFSLLPPWTVEVLLDPDPAIETVRVVIDAGTEGANDIVTKEVTTVAKELPCAWMAYCSLHQLSFHVLVNQAGMAKVLRTKGVNNK
jgi:hypothetical protein